MNKRKPTYFRNSLDLRDKVQVKVLRKRLKLSDEQFASIVRKSGNSIPAIVKEATNVGEDHGPTDKLRASLLERAEDRGSLEFSFHGCSLR
jgi:hypothetical protein